MTMREFVRWVARNGFAKKKSERSSTAVVDTVLTTTSVRVCTAHRVHHENRKTRKQDYCKRFRYSTVFLHPYNHTSSSTLCYINNDAVVPDFAAVTVAVCVVDVVVPGTGSVARPRECRSNTSHDRSRKFVEELRATRRRKRARGLQQRYNKRGSRRSSLHYR